MNWSSPPDRTPDGRTADDTSAANQRSARRAKINNPKPAFGRRGVVAVIIREDRFLVIRRSLAVTAPGKLCFPGGGIEPGEEESESLRREMMEELALEVSPVRRLWRSTTPWGTKLAWWLADILPAAEPDPDPEEVAEVFWMSRLELQSAEDVLPSVPQFFQAWRKGRLSLPLDW